MLFSAQVTKKIQRRWGKAFSIEKPLSVGLGSSIEKHCPVLMEVSGYHTLPTSEAASGYLCPEGLGQNYSSEKIVDSPPAPKRSYFGPGFQAHVILK